MIRAHELKPRPVHLISSKPLQSASQVTVASGDGASGELAGAVAPLAPGRVEGKAEGLRPKRWTKGFGRCFCFLKPSLQSAPVINGRTGTFWAQHPVVKSKTWWKSGHVFFCLSSPVGPPDPWVGTCGSKHPVFHFWDPFGLFARTPTTGVGRFRIAARLQARLRGGVPGKIHRN